MPGTPRGGRPLVGRDEDLAALDDAFDAASEGLVVVLVGADPGLGKTELARSVTNRWAREGVPVHWGACMEIGGAPAYWPWMQVVRSISPEALEGALGALAARPDDAFAAYDVLVEILRDHPVERRVIVLDDLHRADLPSLGLLRFLAATARDLPLLVIGTHRLGELRNDPERDVLLADVGQLGRVLRPAALEVEDVLDLLGAHGDADLAAEILTRSGGNPLFVTHLAAEIARGGRDSLDALPDGIRAAVRARLATLPAATLDALTRAAVLGTEFSAGTLALVLGASDAAVSVALAPAIDEGLLVAGDGTLRFSHVLIRDTLEAELDPHDLARTHAIAARALDDQTHGFGPASSVAQHLLDAGDEVPAAEVAVWADRAASGARRLRGGREAARWSRIAAAAWGRAGDQGRRASSLEAAMADLAAVGDGAAAIEVGAQLATVARATGSGRLLARAAISRSELFEPALDVDAPPLLREAAMHPELADEPRLRAELWVGVASILGIPSVDGFRRDGDGAFDALRQLERLAATTADPAIAGALALARLHVLSGPAHAGDRRRWLEEFEAGCPSDGSVLARLERLYWRTSLAFEAGELAEVDRFLRDWEALAERSGAVFWRWRGAMARASLTFARGSLDLAEARAGAASSLVADLHPAMAMRVAAGLVLSVRHDQARLVEMAGVPAGDLGVLGLLVRLEVGDREGATRLVQRTRALIEGSGPDELAWLCLLSLYVVGADALGDADGCRWAAELLEPFRDQCVMWGRSYVFGGPVAEVLGRARRGAGQLDEATAGFRDALTWAISAGAPGFEARARVGLASVLPVGHPERDGLLDAAAELAGRLGFGTVALEVGAQRATALAAAIGAPVPPGAAAPAGVGAGHERATIRSLGRFEVVGAGCAEPARWSSRKARDALKILVCRRGRSLPREELIDLLWPDVDLATGRNRLSVVLSMVRAALDPDRRLPGDPLQADRQSVGLDAALVAVDVEAFLAAAETALAADGSGHEEAGAALAVAAALGAAGPFLAEDPYADWADSMRHAVDRAQRRVLRAAARVAEGSDQVDVAVAWWALLIDHDPDDDGAWDALESVLEADGRAREVAEQRARRAARRGASEAAAD